MKDNGGGSRLPEYTVRVSRRAKRVILRVTPRLGLEVVVPRDFDPSYVPEIVARKQDWILQARDELERRGYAIESGSGLPERIVLPSVDRAYDVRYGSGRGPVSLVQNGDVRLQFFGDCSDEQACLDLLREWLKGRARQELIPWVRRIAQETGLQCSAVQIRLQRSRWGSCSVRSGLSLNARLLFLSPEMVRYVLLHELSHTRHMHHGPAFWELLTRLEPASRQLDKALNQAWRTLPAWSTRS